MQEWQREESFRSQIFSQFCDSKFYARKQLLQQRLNSDRWMRYSGGFKHIDCLLSEDKGSCPFQL